jgi:Membrane domain of glycerophosphoryl diester phosphodiesterase
MQGPIDLPPPPPLRPRTVGEILEAAFSLYAKYWMPLIQIVAIVVVPLTLLQYALAESVTNNVTTDAAGHVTSVNGGAAGGAAIAWIATLLIEQILIGAVAWAVASVLIGREPSVADSYRYGYRHIWSILLVGILFVLAVIGGLILLIIPGIIFAVRFSVSIPALVVEGKRGTEALGRSWNLVRGRSWSVFGAFIVVSFLTGVLTSVLTALGGSNWFAVGILAAIARCITTPFTGLVLGLIYFDLRVRKEQLDVPTLERELQAAAS